MSEGLGDYGKHCPFYKEPAMNHCRNCMFLSRIQGRHPTTGAVVDVEKCSIAQWPITNLEMAKRMNQISAEISELRTEVRQIAFIVKEAAFAYLAKEGAGDGSPVRRENDQEFLGNDLFAEGPDPETKVVTDRSS